MVFSLCCQREGFYKFLYIIHLFILAGVVCYYFRKSVGEMVPNYETDEEPPQPLGETLRPVWGPMDKCYPVSTQRHKVKSGKKQGSEAMTPQEVGGQNDAAFKEKTGIWTQEEGQEEEKLRQEVAVYPSEASMVESEEESSGGWALHFLRKFWPGWLPASDIPKAKNPR